MNHERLVAGVFAGAGALILLYKGEYVAASTILGTMLGFFIGEKNGERKKTS